MKSYKEFWYELNNEFHFTVDVAADKNHHMTPEYFDAERNGLKQSWMNETVWCNPPYGDGIYDWMNKAKRERYLALVSDTTSKTTIVMMVPFNTTINMTKYFNPNEIRFVGKLSFDGCYSFSGDLMLLIWKD